MGRRVVSAEVLRAAAAEIRSDWSGRYGGGWAKVVAFHLAVADWLDNAAEDLDMQEPHGDLRKQWDMRVHINGDRALTVARAYLGEIA